MTVYNVLVKGKEKEDGQGNKLGTFYWNHTGLTLFKSFHEGEERFGIADARCPGVSFKCFPIEKRQHQGQGGSPPPSDSTPPQSNDEPF